MASRGKRAQALGGAILLALATSTAAQATSASDLFYERAMMTAASRACRLFSPLVSGALAAATAQARGAALRAGASAAQLTAIEARANAAGAAAGCRSTTLTSAAQRVRAAFEDYASLERLEFPAEASTWIAVRPSNETSSGWRVSQKGRFGWDEMTFGLAAHGRERPLMAVALFADGARPYGARLVMREAQVTDGPYLDARAADLSGRLPLDARMPPRAATRVFAAEAMSPAGGDLRPRDAGAAWAFRFPTAAADALASLDPREAVAVEFLFAADGPGSQRTAYVEVGDFAAARAFQALPRP
jgi:hypothetical protein